MGPRNEFSEFLGIALEIELGSVGFDYISGGNKNGTCTNGG